MKKLYSLFITLLLVIISMTSVYASNTYQITIDDAKHSEIKVNKEYAQAGEIVELEVIEEYAYVMSKLDIYDRLGNKIEAKYNNGIYEFIMPDLEVYIRATFDKSEVYHARHCNKGPYCFLWNYDDTGAYDWFHDGLHHLSSIRVVSGYPDGTFKPLENVTRSETISILWKLSGGSELDETKDTKDTKDLWYSEALNWAISNKIISGYSFNNFGMEDFITREQLAVILYNYVKMNNPIESVDRHNYEYVDNHRVSKWADEPLKWAMNNSIILGEPLYGKLEINPSGYINRGLMVQIVSKLIVYIDNL